MRNDRITRSEFLQYMHALEERLNRLDAQARALRESTERAFAEMRVQHDQQTSLLRTAVRQRLELAERRRA